jgi:isopenicillin N synthase-like dioxygenase
MHIYTPPKPATAIPVIDIAGAFSPELAERKKVAWEIHKACRETGFFLITGHGVPQSLIDAQFDWAKRFFALPLEAKMAIHMKNSPSTAGYEPIGGQVLDSQDANAENAPADLKESFYAGLELPDDHPYAVRQVRSFGHNQWPAALPGFREQMLAYHGSMRVLANRLMSLIALSLELPEDYFLPLHEMPVTTLRLIKYPPHPADAAENQLGAGAHTDWGGVTLLAQDDAGGLEVRNVAGEWIAAKPVPVSFVVNLGDLMARWTNGIYNSNLHRVKNAVSGGDRYSVPFFYSPQPHARIECLPTCTDAEHPPQFASCTASEHLNEMFRRSYGYAPIA